jgi:hypothetical protein
MRGIQLKKYLAYAGGHRSLTLSEIKRVPESNTRQCIEMATTGRQQEQAVF